MAANVEQKKAGPFRRLVEYLDWRINPVLLRDLRLYMRGRFMLAAYFLTLAALVMLAMLYAVIARFDGTDGTGLLQVLTALLAIICGAMIPNLVFERFRAELSNRATELALTSPLTPARLVWGKLLGAWCMTFMVVSAAAPMLATAYLLGGVNLLSVFGIVGCVTLAGLTLPILQMYMAADHKGGKGAARSIAALLFVAELVMMSAYSSLLIRTFVGSRSDPEFYYALTICLAIAAVLIGQFLYFTTVGILRGEAENRDVAPRLSLVFAAYAGGILAYLVYWILRDYFHAFGSRTDDWTAFMIIGCVVSYAFSVGFTGICASSPTMPRNLQDHWLDKPLRARFLLPGTGALTAFFLLNLTVILGAVLLGGAFSSYIDLEDWWTYLCMSIVPFMAIAYGIVIYHYLILPLVRDKRNPKLLSHTITIANVVLALLSIFVMVMVSYVWGREDTYNLIMGITPVGLFTACRNDLAADVGWIALCTMAVLFLMLLGVAKGRGGKQVRKGDDGPR